METQVNLTTMERSVAQPSPAPAAAAAGRRGRRLHLGACPRCGGDVRLGRDIYGAYYQCLQCGREISPAALTARLSAATLPAATPAPHAKTAVAERTQLIA